jgi:hypothetical protein
MVFNARVKWMTMRFIQQPKLLPDAWHASSRKTRSVAAAALYALVSHDMSDHGFHRLSTWRGRFHFSPGKRYNTSSKRANIA